MTAYSVGAKRRARQNRQKWAETAECPISGVSIAAGKDAPVRAEKEAMRETLAMRCRVMRWPVDDAHMHRARDARYSTLYGRLAMDGRLDADGCEAIERFERVEREYRRHVLGANLPRPTETTAQCDDYPAFLASLTSQWMDCQAVIGSCSPDVREVFWLVTYAPADVSPHDISPVREKLLKVIAHALGRHFGLMQ